MKQRDTEPSGQWGMGGANWIHKTAQTHGFFCLGLFVVLLMLIPYLILREDAIVVYHDQLDGEMIAYLLQAKHLFQSGGIPEFMGGMGKQALVPPAPLFVLLFLVMQPLAALVGMQLLGSLAGYVGMYLVSRDLTGKKWIGCLVGVLFAYLPFLPVYGLSQYGIPLLLWCFWQLCRERRVTGCIFIVGLYGATSSLVLVGFAVLGLWGVGIAVRILMKKKARFPFIAWLALLAIYVGENIQLLWQIFGGGQEISHKAEYVLNPAPFWNGLWEAFLYGGQHSEDSHVFILAAAAGIVVLLLLRGLILQEMAETEEKACLFVMTGLLGINLGLALVSAFWGAEAGIALRNRMQALRGFQLGRVLWLAPAFWYTILACVLGITAQMAERAFRGKDRRGTPKRARNGIQDDGRGGSKEAALCKVGRAVAGVAVLGVFTALGLTGIQVLKESNLKPNLQKLRNPEYALFSFRDYYALDVMGQVKDYLEETTGQEPWEYRVVSLGIDPAAAYYAGFYCLDGYSNNYPLTYKHQFRRIIAPELEKSEYLRANFDDWGNRCYLFSAEAPGYYTIEDNGFVFWDYQLDVEALAEMGGCYLLSSSYINDSEERGLRLMREEAFRAPGSYYAIFLYELISKEN